MLALGIGLKLGQLLVVHSFSLSSFFEPKFLQTEILGQQFCRWVVVLIPLSGVLPGYRKWPLQVL